MLKSLLVAAALVVSTAAHAGQVSPFLFKGQLQAIHQAAVHAQALNWKVGDENDYSISMAVFIKGTMKMFVRSIDATGAWLEQDVDLSVQQQKVEALIDMNTGETKQLLVNGQPQAIPDQSQLNIVDQEEATITVPAGTFKAIYVKIQDASQNNQITEQWVNPRDIPVNGMLQSISDSTLGKVTMQLTSFKKN